MSSTIGRRILFSLVLFVWVQSSVHAKPSVAKVCEHDKCQQSQRSKLPIGESGCLQASPQGKVLLCGAKLEQTCDGKGNAWYPGKTYYICQKIKPSP